MPNVAVWPQARAAPSQARPPERAPARGPEPDADGERSADDHEHGQRRRRPAGTSGFTKKRRGDHLRAEQHAIEIDLADADHDHRESRWRPRRRTARPPAAPAALARGQHAGGHRQDDLQPLDDVPSSVDQLARAEIGSRAAERDEPRPRPTRLAEDGDGPAVEAPGGGAASRPALELVEEARRSPPGPRPGACDWESARRPRRRAGARRGWSPPPGADIASVGK